MFKTPRGTQDILPQDQPAWQHIENTILTLCHRYGFERISTPVFEDTGLFTRTVGEETDIVQKEMYTFKDRGDSEITLRPEGTAPVCRAYIQHGMHNRPQPVKLYYFATIYRYERPQTGRFREHHQFGAEAIGDKDPSLDAEIIHMAWKIFNNLGLKDLTTQLNTIGCPKCRPVYLENLKDFYSSRIHEMCGDCRVRHQRNPLRLLDCKNPVCQSAADSSPRSYDYLCPECGQHFEKLKTYLRILEIPFLLNHRLVRGLDYYTRTVFEVQPEDVGGQSTIGGGGRYDNLIGELGGPPTPAVGFATGLERIMLNMEKQHLLPKSNGGIDIFIAPLDEQAREKGIGLLNILRQEGFSAMMAAGEKSLKAQLRQAGAFSARYVIIIGEEEIKKNSVILKDMATGEQETIPANSLVNSISKRLKGS
ncbi:MAG: histidine--tRNA ligase [Dehalococcoidia bacterium]|nr:histidine--tRNA ligase [Dehalococcoidia bacterium]MDZ4246832.1 histidine--tRNA ligase [Dehalococcoidia bacterium]